MSQRQEIVPDGTPSDPRDAEGLCLLSLDGGGVRGLSTLYVLKHIMDRLNAARNQEGLGSVKPCDIFDVIGGTSTGGLIAIMLGRLGMDVAECIQAYKDMMKGIFEQSRPARLWAKVPMYPTGKIKPSFSSARLRDAVTKLCAQRSMDAAGTLNDGTERACKTFVCSVAKEDSLPVRLRCYQTNKVNNITPSIVEAALATSAATSYFETATIGNRKFVDGGLAVNNPAEEVEWEAQDIWCTDLGDIKKLVSCFISIGTGVPSTKSIEDSLRLFATDTMPSLISETERTEKRIVARWRQELDEGRFFRFNVDQGLQSVGLADYQQEGLIDTATTTYLNHQVQLSRDFRATHIYTEHSRLHADSLRKQGYATREEILASLRFAEHDARIKMLNPPWAQTFDWIFEPPHDLDTLPDFPLWLRSGSGIYWISGKLGSGKSTIMAHILHNKRTMRELQGWARPAHLHVLSFFFWRAGSQRQELQNTIAGLLRSLIFQLLEQVEGLAEVVGKRCHLQTGQIGSWEENNLRTLLHEAISAAENERLCFFIDGLDEYQGDYNKLATDVCSIFQRHPHAKLCVSSRPEEPLVQRFAAHSRLRMEQLNYLDIKQYVVNQLGDYDQQHEGLAYEICYRADGVFLWAVVVAREFVLGMQNGEDAGILEKRIQRLNPEMDKLFSVLLGDIDELHKHRLAFFLNVMSLTTDGGMRLPSVALLTAALAKNVVVPYGDFAQQCETTRRSIYAYSKGLLQVGSGWSGTKAYQEVEGMWSIPQEAFLDLAGDSAALTASIVKSRRAAWFPRDSTQHIDERQVICHLLSTMEWSHRSAYDFVAKRNVQAMLGLDRSPSRPEVLAKLVRGHLRLLTASPSRAASRSGLDDALPSSLVRMKIMIDIIATAPGTEEEHMYGLLDELGDVVKHMEQDDLKGVCDEILTGRTSGHTGEITSKWRGLQVYDLNNSSSDGAFWLYCVEVKLVRFIQNRLHVLGSVDVCAMIVTYSDLSESNDFKLQGAGAQLFEALLRTLLEQRARVSHSSSNPRIHASLYKGRPEYRDITWTSSVCDETLYRLEEAVVCKVSMAWRSWSFALAHRFLNNIERDRALTFSKLFIALLDEWDVYIGTRSWKDWRQSKLTLQMSAAGLAQGSLLPAETKQGLSVHGQPSFRLFYNAPYLTSTFFDVAPIHNLATALNSWHFAPPNFSSLPHDQLRNQSDAYLRRLVGNDEAFRRALIENIAQRRPATRFADEMIQALRDREHWDAENPRPHM
ncbi:hypothetical protein LTS10_002619 [Elasticomyces elasticus]|nr:hypothetical protein LTS10_002619 [Elasticomyces elasticus]